MAKSSMPRPSSIPDLRLRLLAINPNDGVCESGTTGHHAGPASGQPARAARGTDPSRLCPQPRGPGLRPPGKRWCMPPFGPIDPLPRLKRSAKHWPAGLSSGRPHRTPHHGRGAASAPGVLPGEPGARDQGLYRSGDWTTHAHRRRLCDQAGLRPRQ